MEAVAIQATQKGFRLFRCPAATKILKNKACSQISYTLSNVLVILEHTVYLNITLQSGPNVVYNDHDHVVYYDIPKMQVIVAKELCLYGKYSLSSSSMLRC